ncbi:MAG TPA: hypothetical protein VF391_02285 [Dermatophilaceae bacterium]
MATIVLIHGIAQEQLGADSLQSRWRPALADGVRAAGYPDLADLVAHDTRPGGINIRMAFYGDLFLTPGTMGIGTADPANETQRELVEQLAAEWLARAAGREVPDRSTAATQLSYLNPAGHDEQGALREGQRSALNGLAKLRWFAPFGMAFSGRFVATSLHQVTRYLTDEEIREAVQQRVSAHLDADTQVLIGHSLGSVVAYEAAHRLARPLPLLITLGSPLGLGSVVYDRIVPQPPAYPPQVHRWVNIADRNDLIAARPDLSPMFGTPPTGAVFDGGWTVHNGAKPHQAEFYLTKEQTGRPIGEVLHGSQLRHEAQRVDLTSDAD